ncbi:complement component C6-like [Ciona intestinalis]
MRLLFAVIAVLALVLLFCEGGEAWWSSRRRSVSCIVSNWGPWAKCSKTCGGGKAIRSRYIKRNSAHGGTSCPTLHQTGACTQKGPCPITCKWSAWSAWSNCDPCFPGARSKSRNIAIPAMFNGAQCTGSRALTDLSCKTTQACIEKTCPASKFSCIDGLGCISKTLRCNGDNDCADRSDEKHCSKGTIHSPCGNKKFKGIPNIDIAGAGFDIIKGREEGKIMDNQQYDGRCSTVKSGDIGERFRKPANVQFYRFQVCFNILFEIVLISVIKLLDRTDLNPTLVSLSLKASSSNSRQRNIVTTFGTNFDSKFFTVSSNIQVAQFRMVRRNLLLSYEFRRRLKELPDNFDYTKYAQVISDFGTHFYSRGVLGGRYEYVYRYSKNDLRMSRLTDHQQKLCLSSEAGISFFGNVFSIGSSKCSTNALSKRHQGSFTRSATNAASNVIGGKSDKAAALSLFLKRKPNKTGYDEWVETVKHNPAIIDYMLSPISSAVPLSMLGIRKNIERALVLYLKEYDYSKCTGKCAHGAAVVVVNKGKLCKCLCPANYGGIDCHVRA